MTPSQQARADATADAETLRLLVYETEPGRPVLYNNSRAAQLVRKAFWRHPSDLLGRPSLVAHFAFLAVPGLRG